ncbi:hypothetical protein DL89DRAFT_268532 [Linderina pennispora]|uniref:SURP motif domain-containing protein n=1 Tax=Linderina pennispora TaxID=61395 RepID=A0A1Y1W5E9_9FUNG|nr:uncharacterized protein DL89DRAFT_268532 [Linderina pennispora]ORX68761.1 hypothetical protein DL89DRAFT_268532 [Linderina pennispora]
MDSHRIRQQKRKEWLALKRERYGKGFLASTDDEPDSTPIVFGYGARIFEQAERSDRADLIQLAETNTLVDRYDIRYLIDMNSIRRNEDTGTVVADPEMDARRFKSLETEENERCIFYMDSPERQAYIRQISEPDSEDASEASGTALQYDVEGKPVAPAVSALQLNHLDEANTDPPFCPSFSLSDGMAAPKSQRHFEIIERTARFISSQPADRSNQMELTIQGKQGNNSDFYFLNRDDSLYPFYKHIRWLMQAGLYGYNDESDSGSQSADDSKHDPESGSEEPSPDGDDKHANGEAAVPIQVPDDIMVPDGNARAVIDKVAKLVSQSADPPKLETKLRVEKATSMAMYSFLSPFDKCNAYYVFRRDCFARGVQVEDIVCVPAEPVMDDNESKMAKRRRLAKEFLNRKKQRPV